MKCVYLSGVLWLSSVFSALAVPVTFQVDLGPRINFGEFDPANDVIEVRGSFSDWSGGFALSPVEPGSTLYTGTRDIAGDPESTVEFKFVQVRDGTDTWESTPNRAFSLPGEAAVLPVAYFNNEWEGDPLPVTFQVNMATQQAAGNFVPEEGDFVEVRGSFNNWSGGFFLSPSAGNPDVYEGTADVGDAPGSRVEYKFVINRIDGRVIWENDPNRAFTQVDEAQELPVVHFNNVTGVPIKAIVRFQIDMNTQIDAGLFDTNVQEVYIRGNTVGWGEPPEGLQLFADAARPGIYTNLLRSDSMITGDRIEYKATIWAPETFNTTWEDGANKVLTFTGSEPQDSEGYLQADVGPYFFNDVRPGDLLTEDTLVTFRVDMRNARTAGGLPFDPEIDFVVLNGAFLPGGWQPWGGVLDTLAFDDGASSGDTDANDLVYTVQVTVPRGTPARLEYKYGINGEDNEAPEGENHVRYVLETGSYVMPMDVFGTMIQEPATDDLGQVSIGRDGSGKVTISWDPQPGVRLQKLTSLEPGSEGIEVPGTEGQGSYEVPTSDPDPMAFFRLVRP